VNKVVFLLMSRTDSRCIVQNPSLRLYFSLSASLPLVMHLDFKIRKIFIQQVNYTDYLLEYFLDFIAWRVSRMNIVLLYLCRELNQDGASTSIRSSFLSFYLYPCAVVANLWIPRSKRNVVESLACVMKASRCLAFFFFDILKS
jgi:hypothetical protein